MSIAEYSTKRLKTGQRLTREEFLRRWEALPDVKFAELIDGVVYMPSPTTRDHGRLEFKIEVWLGTYSVNTPGTDGGSQSTWLMLRSAPQPDCYLWVLPEFGGQSSIQGKYHLGAPELAAEFCLTSAAYDLGVKKTLYEKAGVKEYVAFLVEEQETRWHRLIHGAYELMQPSPKGLYRSKVFPGLWLDAPALWKHELARVLRTLQRGVGSAEHTRFVKSLAARRR
jgi:Uma2 family endonuclease